MIGIIWWGLLLVLLANAVNASQGDTLPPLEPLNYSNIDSNHKLFLKESLLDRLNDYGPHYCTLLAITKGSDPLRPLRDSIEEAIKTVDTKALEMLNVMLPIKPDCNTPIWTIFHYQKLLLPSPSNGEIDYNVLVKEHEKLFSEIKSTIKNAVTEILQDVHNEDLHSSVQQYLDESNMETQLREMRNQVLGNIFDPTAHQIARLVIYTVESPQDPSRWVHRLPPWMFHTMGAVHIINNITTEKEVVNDFLAFLANCKDEIGSWLYNHMGLYVKKQENFGAVISFIVLLENYIQNNGADSALEGYLLNSEYGPSFIAIILKDADLYLFRNYCFESITPDICEGQKRLDDCIWELIRSSYAYRLTNYKPQKATDEAFKNVTCDYHHFEFSRKPIGSGSYGKVFYATHKDTNIPVAIKVTSKENLEIAPWVIFIEEEVTIRVQHENVSSAYCSFLFDGQYFLVMPYYSGGTLEKKMGKVTEDELATYVQQMLEGAMALHTEGILHNDLKPDNVLLDGQGRVKIIDFGISSFLQFNNLHTSSLITGTRDFMPGDVLFEHAHGPATDIYSIGVIAWVLWNGKYFDGQSWKTTALAKHLLDGNLTWILPDASKELNELIATLTSPYPYDRWEKVYVDWENFQKNPLFKSPWKGNPKNLLEKSAHSPSPISVL